MRLKLDGRMVHEPLPGAVIVSHEPMDLLVFSAHLIHKGVYGGERQSFDIILTGFKESRENAAAMGHFPDEDMKKEIGNARIFDLR